MTYVRTEEIREKQRASMLETTRQYTEEQRKSTTDKHIKTVEQRRLDGIHYKNWIPPEQHVCEFCHETFEAKKKSPYCCAKCYWGYRRQHPEEFERSDRARKESSTRMLDRHAKNREIKLTDEEHQRLLCEFRKYKQGVNKLTERSYAKYYDVINPDGHPRTLCGVVGGYQLDHKISIRFGFENGIRVEDVADVSNLQMLPWMENLKKGKKNYII